ncbi:CHAT domain-containing tetratricopeptide repeat protein [Leptothoe sp. EHU-05/26/07-4]
MLHRYCLLLSCLLLFIPSSVTASSTPAVNSVRSTLAQTASSQELKDQADGLLQTGVTAYGENRLDDAIDSLQTALSLYQQINDTASLSLIWQTLALIYGQQGLVAFSAADYTAAITHYQQQLNVAQQLGDPSLTAQAFGNLGSAAVQAEQFDVAETYLQQSLALSQTDPLNQARALSLLAVTYSVLGNYDRLLNTAQELEEVATLTQNPSLQIQAAQSLGIAYFFQGDYPQALTYHQQVVTLAEALEDPYFQAIGRANVGETQLALKQPEIALETLPQALTLAQATGDPTLIGNVLGTLGLAHATLGNYGQATDLLQQRLQAEQAAGSLLGTAQTLNNLGNVAFLDDRLDEAAIYLQQAIRLWEDQRSTLGTDDQSRIQLFDTQVLTYRTLQQVFVAQGQPELALEVTEQGRARSFVEQLAKENPTPAQPKPTLAGLKRIAQEQQITVVEYALIVDNQEIFAPQRRDNQLQNQPMELLIWVVQPTGEIQFEQVDLTDYPALGDLVADARSDLGVLGRGGIKVVSTFDPEQQGNSLRQLHDILIAPIVQHLPPDPTEPVVVIPQESLLLVPFAALLDDDNRYLIEHHTLLSAPSLQALGFIQPASGSGAVVVGDPTMPEVPGFELAPLPGAEKEAIAIAPLLNTTPLLGEAATEATVVPQLANARWIHLATHGLLDYAGEDESITVPGAIALAAGDGQDGLLTATEIANLSLSAELVVLSACDTGRGEITGDGVVGLSRSLLLAGAEQVMVSLWAVPDAPTADLMQDFYQQVTKNPHLSYAQALRQAMLQAIEQDRTPREWAGFNLIGNSL